ncbi:MAG: glycosyltransferase [Candidatus Hadarchaeum sp.]
MLLQYLVIVGLVCFLFNLVLNLRSLRVPRPDGPVPYPAPMVSVLVPARNEERNIRGCLESLLSQDYPSYEVLVLDDESTDGTSSVALQAAAGDPRLRVLNGSPLPEGWLGKNWACHQLAQQASGDWLVFTDADVQWEPEALTAMLALMQRSGADMLTVWPTQRTKTWAERLVVPLVMLVVIGYLPEIAVRFLPWSAFAAANGQCIVFRRSAYEAIGGHQAVAARVVEDVALARLAKKQGQRLVMALGHRLIATRMYTSWQQVRDGFAKNILAGHGGWLMLVLSTVFHWLVFLAPWFWLALGSLFDLGPGWPWFPISLISLGLGVRALSAAICRQRLLDTLLMPVSVVLMTLIAARALTWHFSDGPQWKGRRLTSLMHG